MFDRLFSLLESGWDTVKPFQILNPYERGVHLRYGKLLKIIGPGVCFKRPFVDEFQIDNIVPNTTALHEQTLTTKDGVTCIVRGMVLWCIWDVKKMLLEVEDADTVLVDVVHGVITDLVITNKWDYVRSPAFIKQVSLECRQAAWKYGMNILSVKMIDLVKAPALRLIGER